MSKMLGNIGKATVGTARAGLNVGLAALKTPGAKLAQARSAALTRKSNIEKGITRKLGSRLGLRDRETNIQDRTDKTGKKKSTRPVQKINTDQKVPTPKALPAARSQKALPAARSQKALPAARSQKALPSSTTGSALRAPTNPMTQRQKNDARIAAFKKKREEQRAAGIPMRSNATEEFIYEVGQMKEKKLNKVIDILKGKKNDIEISPKIKESMNWKDNYKPIEIETTNLIEPKKLNPSDWRKEIFEI